MAFGYTNEGKQRGTIKPLEVDRILIRYKESGARVRVTESVARRAIENCEATHVRSAKMTAKKR